jgi:class 3 adenylate cyclase/tetratricopeptide (TPR) repeat protein
VTPVCPTCASAVPDGAKFCGECGAPLLPRCGLCGTPAARMGQKFCLECGTPLVAGARPASAPATAQGSGPGSPAAEPAARVGASGTGPAVVAPSTVERRQVSVLFADLTGFTRFSEARDAEDVRDMLSEYFETARRIVASYGGRVEKFIGDAVMALWGAPVAEEDDAERAVRAALDLVAAVTALGDRLGLELRLRAGVLTGRAAVELDAVDEGMVIGDAINTASRLQSVAEPGTALVDDVTRAVTAAAIAYEDAGEHVVKGKTEPLHAWRALRVIATVGGTSRSDLELPLVGRDEEIGVIRGALDRLIGSDSGLQLVSVVGDPGLGKSRLAWELKKYADGLAADVLWHHGQALSFGQGAGLSSLAEMVRVRAKISVEDLPSSQRRKLEVLVEDLFASADRDSRDRALRGLGRLLGFGDVHEFIDTGELFTSWRLLFERLAERDPVVLLFQDLHWADQGLFDFIAHLSEWASRSRILVLVFSRPDERLAALAALGRRIDLQPLSEADIETLVGAAVEGAPASLLSAVGAHAGGVPLFAVESLRMLADRGVMVAEGDAHRYRVVGAVDDLDVPPSIQALIASRLDRLGDLERRILRGGAILGQRFSLAAVAALAGLTTADAQSLLDGLVAKQFLSVDTDARSGTLVFVHRLVQRVVLDTLSKRERKARHLAAVDYLTDQAPDPDLPAILAGHLVAAFDAHPTAADALVIRARALTMTLEAAERAESVGALNEAVALFAQAARIESDPARRADHFVRAARCAERYGNQEEVAAGHYASARDLHEQAGRTREALRLRARELSVYRWSRPPAELIGPLRELYASLRDEHDAAFAAAAATLAVLLYGDGAAEEAETIAAEAAVAAEEAAAYEELGVALNCRASALIEMARPVEALPLFEAALAIRERHAPSDVAASLGNIAVTLAALGRFDEAVAAGREATAAAERVASLAHRNMSALYLARGLFSLGRWDESVAAVDEVAAETPPANRGMVLGPRLLIALHRGELGAARDLIEEFDRQQQESGPAFESDYRSLREAALATLAGDALGGKAVIDQARSGDYAEWPTWLPLAIDLVAGLPGDQPLREAALALQADLVPTTSPIVIAQSARLDALLAMRAGDRVRAAARFSDAIRAANAAGMTFDTAVLRLECFEQLREQATAVAGLHNAVDAFSRLRATPWSERAQRALRAGQPDDRPSSVQDSTERV